jgi:hypothetical protein
MMMTYRDILCSRFLHLSCHCSLLSLVKALDDRCKLILPTFFAEKGHDAVIDKAMLWLFLELIRVYQAFGVQKQLHFG